MEKTRSQILAVFLLCLVQICSPAHGEEPDPTPIVAPFGVPWGVSPEDLAAMLKNFTVKASHHNEEGKVQRIEVTGIPQKNLQRAVFHFEENMLWEIELQLGEANWNAEDFNRFYLLTKRALEKRYGPGMPLALDKKSVEDMETVLGGYLWRQVGGSIQFYFFQAKRNGKEYRVLSQHYRPY